MYYILTICGITQECATIQQVHFQREAKVGQN